MSHKTTIASKPSLVASFTPPKRLDICPVVWYTKVLSQTPLFLQKSIPKMATAEKRTTEEKI